MTVTAKQIADELLTISASEPRDVHSFGWTAVLRIVNSLLRGTPDFVTSRPKDGQTSIADWAAQYGITFKDLPQSADDTTIRLHTDPYYNTDIQKIAIKGDNAVFSFQYRMTVSTVKTRAKTVWKNIDEDTRKRVPVLDDKDQPVFETLPPQTTESKITAKMTVPLSFFVELLTEVGRDTLLALPPENYVPPVIGEALMNVLGAAGIHPGQERMMRAMAQMASMGPRMVACDDGWGGKRRGNMEYFPDVRDLMMMVSEDYAMLGYGRGKPVPCRVFLQPDDQGRMEIIAEPYSAEEIKQNQLLRGSRSQWAEWRVSDTEAVQKRLPPKEEPKQFTKSIR